MYRGESSRAASAGAKRYLTCGQMARANCVTEKTLRFYQEKGLLAPEHVDDETGFRYYDIAQSTKLDLITQLRTIGLSLDEICELADERDMDKLHASLDGQLRALAAKRRELEHAERLAAELLHDCDMYQNPTLVNEIILEFMPPRHRLEFAIPPLDELVRGVGDFSGSDQWEWLVRHVKQVIVERGWPLSLFRDVGYIAARDRLHCDDLWANRAFVAVDASFGECFVEAVPFPEGFHLVMYVNQGFSDEGDRPRALRAHARLCRGQAPGSGGRPLRRESLPLPAPVQPEHGDPHPLLHAREKARSRLPQGQSIRLFPSSRFLENFSLLLPLGHRLGFGLGPSLPDGPAFPLAPHET